MRILFIITLPRYQCKNIFLLALENIALLMPSLFLYCNIFQKRSKPNGLGIIVL